MTTYFGNVNVPYSQLAGLDRLDYKLSQNKSSGGIMLDPPCFLRLVITVVSCSVIMLPRSIWKVFPALVWQSVSHTRHLCLWNAVSC